MKIIKEGDPKNRNCKKFTCGICGCVFEATKGEWEIWASFTYVAYMHRCPCCGEQACILEKRDQNYYDPLDVIIMKKQYSVK